MRGKEEREGTRGKEEREGCWFGVKSDRKHESSLASSACYAATVISPGWCTPSVSPGVVRKLSPC